MLRLDYNSLKKRVEVPDRRRRNQKETAAPAFVVLVGPVPGGVANCTVEVESGQGAKLRLDLPDRLLGKANAPLDNNLCERALKRAVLYRNNALFHKTLNGAQVGDLIMSLIHTAELCDANPFDYLSELQRPA